MFKAKIDILPIYYYYYKWLTLAWCVCMHNVSLHIQRLQWLEAYALLFNLNLLYLVPDCFPRKFGFCLDGHQSPSSFDTYFDCDWNMLFQSILATEIIQINDDKKLEIDKWSIDLLFEWSFWLGWKQFGARYERSGRKLTGGNPGTCRFNPSSAGNSRSWSPVRKITPNSSLNYNQSWMINEHKPAFILSW